MRLLEAIPLAEQSMRKCGPEPLVQVDLHFVTLIGQGLLCKTPKSGQFPFVNKTNVPC